jgi:hypothetical protein
MSPLCAKRRRNVESKLLHENGERTYAPVFDKGDVAPGGLRRKR